jgi:hypothetical protein
LATVTANTVSLAIITANTVVFSMVVILISQLLLIKFHWP